MKRVLVVTSAFAPAVRPGVYRPLKFVKYLRRFGYEPEVLWVNGNRRRPVDTSLLRDVPEGVKVNRVTDWVYHGLCSASAKLFSRPVLRADHAFYSKALKLARRAHRERPFDAMYLTAPPLRLPALGTRIARALDVPWILDLRDPWGTLTPGLTTRGELEARMIEQMERDAYDSASRAVVVLDGMRREMLEKYPDMKDKLRLIHNGYDEEEFEGLSYSRRDDDEFRLFYGGTSYRGHGFEQIPAALSSALEGEPGLRKRLRFVITGRRSGSLAAALRERGLRNNIQVLGHIRNCEFVREIVGADALFFFMPWQYAATQRLFNYLRAGRPILAVCPPGGPAAKLVREFDAGTIVPPGDAAALVTSLVERYREWQQGGVPSRPVSDDLKQYERSHLTRLLAAELDAIISSR